MTLEDTIDLMKSEDWKDRLLAEYYQTKIRYNKLLKFLECSIQGSEIFDLTFQESSMKSYLNVLERRLKKAKIEYKEI